MFDAVLFGVMPDGLGMLGVAAITGAAVMVTLATWRPGAGSARRAK